MWADGLVKLFSFVENGYERELNYAGFRHIGARFC